MAFNILSVLHQKTACHKQSKTAEICINCVCRIESFSEEKCEIAIDEASLGIIQGAEIDWIDEVKGQHFELKRIPSSERVCGCGTSFSVK